ncbi:hypothetical protein [Sphingopyxis sp. MSC1_008]|uniref:hypothetical protein n=1 Tax=Sphingopyxis sp. MSC1_008 TaxID=2909265 RepID=UPI0020BEF78C|nr:hypothetical protein [Sphingopyxis sp. MSC1_008]
MKEEKSAEKTSPGVEEYYEGPLTHNAEPISRRTLTLGIVGVIAVIGASLFSGMQDRTPAALQREYDDAIAEVENFDFSAAPPPAARMDPELEMGSRQAVELNEMICKQTGQNCELAEMARKQHMERYWRF